MKRRAALATLAVLLITFVSQPALAGPAAESDKFAQVRGFKVELVSDNGAIISAWESATAEETTAPIPARTLSAAVTLRGCLSELECATSELNLFKSENRRRTHTLRITPVILLDGGKSEALAAVELLTCTHTASEIYAPADPEEDVLPSTAKRVMRFQCDLQKDKKGRKAVQSLAHIQRVHHEVAKSTVQNMR